MTADILERKAYLRALKLQKRKDFPAAIIAAGKSNFIKTDRTGPILPHIICFKLRIKLSSIGKLYTLKNGNYIGWCSEVNAANRILLRFPYLDLKEINFSKAIRPRTMQKIPTCTNCKNTFNS